MPYTVARSWSMVKERRISMSLAPLQRPVAVLFDFDGVVVDSAPVHVDAWDATSLDVLGRRLDDNLRARILGHNSFAIARMICGRDDQKLIAELVERKRRELETAVSAMPVIPGVREYFARLNELKIPFGIASNSPRAFVADALAAVSLAASVVLGCEDAARPKPAPDLYLACAKRLGVSVADHRQILVFEDSTHGLAAVKAAGMVPMGIASQHPIDELLAAGALAAFRDFSEFLVQAGAT